MSDRPPDCTRCDSRSKPVLPPMGGPLRTSTRRMTGLEDEFDRTFQDRTEGLANKPGNLRPQQFDLGLQVVDVEGEQKTRNHD